MFLKEGFASHHLLEIEGVYLGNFRSKHGLKINGVVIRSMGWEFVMGLLREYILKFLALIQNSRFILASVLHDLGGNGYFSNSFSGQPLFSLPKSV